MKFRNYKNKHTNNNVIHSYENLMGMTFDEITDRANELGTQYKQIGLPTNSELNSSPNAVYVHAYTRDDGTQVRAHWRGVNGGNNSIAGQIQNGVSIPNYNDGIYGDVTNGSVANNTNGYGYGNDIAGQILNGMKLPKYPNGIRGLEYDIEDYLPKTSDNITNLPDWSIAKDILDRVNIRIILKF